MTEPLHPMDDHPPEELGEWMAGVSVDVRLHYADGSTRVGYRDPWIGWTYYENGTHGATLACDDDDAQPVGWSALDGGE